MPTLKIRLRPISAYLDFSVKLKASDDQPLRSRLDKFLALTPIQI